MKKQITPEDFKIKQRTMFDRKRELVRKATPSELILQQRLNELGIRHFFQKAFIAGDFYCIADFYIPKPYKIVIEVDGPYYLNENQKKRDWAKDNYLRSRKVKVIRIKNEDAATIDLIPLIMTAK